MKIQSILLVIFLSLLTSVAFGGDNEKATLSRLLYSKNAGERQQAFNIITSNIDKYRTAVLAELQSFARNPNKTPDALLYLAAFIKDQRYIRPLVKLINNDKYSADHCLYSCPIVFSLAVFSSFTGDSVSGLNDKLNAVHDYKSECERVKSVSLEPEYANKYASGTGIDSLLEELEALPLAEVIKQAEPENTDGHRRMAAAIVLQAHIANDKYIKELYWLAINNLPSDASGEFRDSIHWAIYKAETYRKQRK